ncbi:MAG: hypothetical protein ABI830_15440, partial [Pseudolabrys sp.]
DVSMGALSGTLAERSHAALRAGCDVVLHCNGDLAEMTAVAGATPALSGDAARRAALALAMRNGGEAFDIAAARAIFTKMLGGQSPQSQRMTGS